MVSEIALYFILSFVVEFWNKLKFSTSPKMKFTNQKTSTLVKPKRFFETVWKVKYDLLKFWLNISVLFLVDFSKNFSVEFYSQFIVKEHRLFNIYISEISVNHDSQRLKIGAGCACLARTNTYLRIKYNAQNLNYQIYHN